MPPRRDIGAFLDGGAGPPLTEPPPIPPPAPLPAPRRHVGTLDDCVRSLVAEFRALGRGEGAARLAALASKEWRGNMRTLAADLMEEGLSPVGFVRLAVSRLTQKQGRFPRPEQVFGARMVEGWLKDYRRGGAAEVGLLPEYTATPERVALHGRRYGESVQAEPGHGGGGRAAAPGGPGGDVQGPPPPEGRGVRDP